MPLKDKGKRWEQVNTITEVGLEKGHLVVEDKWNIAQELKQLQYGVRT